MKKKILLFLSNILLVLMVAFQVEASDVYTEDYLKYTINDNAICICGYFGSEKEVTIPATIAGYPVSEIASGAFSNADTVEKVNLPDTVMKVENNAFSMKQIVVYNSNTEQPEISSPDDLVQNDSEQEETNTPSNEEVEASLDDDLAIELVENTKDTSDDKLEEKKNDSIILFICVIVILVVAGVCIYRKKKK